MARHTRTRYSREERARLLAEFRRSDQTPADFAAGHGVKVRTLRAWLRAGPTGGAGAGAGRGARPRFVEVEAPCGPPDSEGTEAIRLAVGRVTVEVPASVGALFLAELICSLDAPPC